MARPGAPTKGPDGLLDVLDCAAFIINHLGKVAGGREPAEVDPKALVLEQERARLTKEQADKVALENHTSREELLPRADVITAWTKIVAAARAKLLALPTKLAPLLASIDKPIDVQEKLTSAIHESLAELAETRAIPARGSGSADADGDDVDPGDVRSAAKPDGKRVGRPKPKAKSRGKQRAR